MGVLRDYRPRILFPRPKIGKTFHYSVELLDLNGDSWRFGVYARSLWSCRVLLSNWEPVLCGWLKVMKIWRTYTNDIEYVRESWTRKQV